MTSEKNTAIYNEVTGGAELLRCFGGEPSFHDAEILGLDLRRKGKTILRLQG